MLQKLDTRRVSESGVGFLFRIFSRRNRIFFRIESGRDGARGSARSGKRQFLSRGGVVAEFLKVFGDHVELKT